MVGGNSKNCSDDMHNEHSHVTYFIWSSELEEAKDSSMKWEGLILEIWCRISGGMQYLFDGLPLKSQVPGASFELI